MHNINCCSHIFSKRAHDDTLYVNEEINSSKKKYFFSSILCLFIFFQGAFMLFYIYIYIYI